jgi:hypothetical protein
MSTTLDARAALEEDVPVPYMRCRRTRVHSPATDVNAYVPLERMREAAAAGRIDELAPRFHGVPTNRSQRATTVQSPERWTDDPSWKRDYANAEALSADELAELRREFDGQKSVAKARRAE